MAKGSDNPYPSVLLDEQGAAPTTPAAGFWRLYTKTDGLYIVDDAGVETGPFAVGGGAPNFGAGVIKTIASDIAAAGSDRQLIIAAQTGTADNLIEVTGLSVGDEVVIRADAGDTITVKHNDAGATDKLLLNAAADLALSGDVTLKLIKTVAGKVVEYVGAVGGGGSIEVVRTVSASDLTTTSTTFVPIDSTNIGYTQHQHTLAVGDVVECILIGSLYFGSGSAYVYTDLEIDQPTSADIYLSGGTSSGNGSTIDQLDIVRRIYTYVYTFIATEAGLHQFRPVWKTASGTPHIDGSFTATYFTTKKLPV